MKEKRLTPLDSEAVSESANKTLNFLKSRIVGQDRALDSLVRALERQNSPLRDKRKPIGSFLFLGPSRVGKTETARALARYLFEDPNGLVYIDCTKFSQPHEVAQLKGSPPGYVGWIDSDREHDTAYPLLSPWNVYKYHHFYLAKKHKNEIDEINKLGKEVYDLRKETDEFAKKLNALQEGIANLTYQHDFLLDELSFFDGKKPSASNEDSQFTDMIGQLREIDKKLRELEDKKKKLAEDYQLVQRAFHKLDDKLTKEHLAACKKGWIYDPDMPPEDLIGIVVFDEIEKADVSLHDHLMEITDTGQFKCSNGQVTQMKNCIVIMTSNAGQEKITGILKDEKGQLGFSQSKQPEGESIDDLIYKAAINELQQYFRLEFLNRLGKIIVYRPISIGSMYEILDIRIRDLEESLKESGFKLNLVFDQSAKDFLIARSMKRVEQGAGLLEKRLTDYVRDSLVVFYSTQQIKDGDTIVIKENASNDELEFYKEED